MTEGNISIAGLDKAAVLAALYDNAKPLGLGFLHFTPEPMTLDEAREILSKQKYFDYLKGRVMKVSLDGDELRPHLYDRDNGHGAAASVIEQLRSKSQAA